MPHSERKLLTFIYKHKSTIFFWISFVVVFVFINTVSNVAYDKFFRLNNETVATSTTNIVTGDKPKCSVLGINLHGTLFTYAGKSGEGLFADTDTVTSEKITSLIQRAENDDKIKAIIIEVDSGGGEPVAGEEIANALKTVTKPVVAFIRQNGLSAAYRAISSANRIFASKDSSVGSIGVTASYLQNIDKDKRFIQLSVGKYKDMGNPDHTLTEEERILIMRDAKIMHQNFIEDVANNRNIPIDTVRKIADGSSVLGEQAIKLGLIDEIGGLIEVRKYLEDMFARKLFICWDDI